MAKKQNLNSDISLRETVDAFGKLFRAILNDQAKHPEKYAHLTQETVGNPVTLGPRVITPEEWAGKLASRASAAAETWLANVKRPRKDPVDAAIKANEKRKDKLAEAEKNKKWEKAMTKVSHDEMYATIDKVGSSGYRSGVDARLGKITRVVKELQPMVATLADTIDKMPQNTDAQREARLLAARKGMIEIGKKRIG